MNAKQRRAMQNLVSNPRWQSDVVKPLRKYFSNIETKIAKKIIKEKNMPTPAFVSELHSPSSRQRQIASRKLLDLGFTEQDIEKIFDDAKKKHIEKIKIINIKNNFRVVAPTTDEFISFYTNNPHQDHVNIGFNVPNSVLYFLYGLFILDYLHDNKRYIPQNYLVYIKQICLTILKNSAISFFDQAIFFANAEIAELTANPAIPITLIANDLIDNQDKIDAMNNLLIRIGNCANGLRDMAQAINIKQGNATNTSLGGNYENNIIHVTQHHFFSGLTIKPGNASNRSNIGVFSYEEESTEFSTVYNAVVGSFNNHAIFRSVIKDSGNKYIPNALLYCNRDWSLVLNGVQGKGMVLSSAQTEDNTIQGINRKWTDNITIDANPYNFYTFPQRPPNTFTQGTKLLRDGNSVIIDKLFDSIIDAITLAFYNILTIVRDPPDVNILTIQMAILQKIQLPIGNPVFLIPNVDLVANPDAIQQAIQQAILANPAAPAAFQQAIQQAILANPAAIQIEIKTQLRIQNIKIANISYSIMSSNDIYSSIISGINTIDQNIRDAAANDNDVITQIDLAISQVPLLDPNENGITNDNKIARSANTLRYFFEKISKDLFIVIESIIYSILADPIQMGFCTNDISNYNIASVLYKIIQVCNQDVMPNVSLELRCDKTKIISSLGDPLVTQNINSVSKGLESLRKLANAKVKLASIKLPEINLIIKKNITFGRIGRTGRTDTSRGGKGFDISYYAEKLEKEAKIRGDKIKKEKEDEKKRKEQIQKRIEEEKKKNQQLNKDKNEKEEIIINQKFDDFLNNASLIITILLRTDKYRDVIGNKLLPKHKSDNFVFDEYSDEPWNFDAFSEKVNNLYIDYFGKYNLNIHVDENDIIDGLNNEFKDSSEKKEFIEEIEYAPEEEDLKEEDENYLTELYNLPIESYDLLQMLRQFNDANNVFFDSLKILLPELLPEIFSDSSKIKKDELLNLCLRAYVYKTTNIDNISQDVKDENEAQIETIRQVYCPLASTDSNIKMPIKATTPSMIDASNKSESDANEITIYTKTAEQSFLPPLPPSINKESKKKKLTPFYANDGSSIKPTNNDYEQNQKEMIAYNTNFMPVPPGKGGKRKTRRNKPKKTRKRFQKRSKKFQKKSRKA
jgi:hypothetical protein